MAKIKLTFSEKDLVKSIATRVANKPVLVEITDNERLSYTDGKMISVGATVDVFTTMSVAAHEGSHIRFKSKSTIAILRHINKDYPKVAQFVLNCYEDYRCNTLNKRIYKGFVKRLHENGEEITKGEVVKDKLMNTIKQILLKLEYPHMFDEDNTYPIWIEVDKSKKMIDKYLAFESSVIVSKMIVDTIMDYHKMDPEARPPDKKKMEDMEKGMGRSTLPELGGSSSERKSLEIVKDYEAGAKGDYKRLSKATKRLMKHRKEIMDELRKMKIVPKAPEPTYMKTGVTKMDLPLPSHGSGDSYDEVKIKNHPIITQLRKEFKRIMRSSNAGRGGRKGRVSVRDLPRFVSSKGRFNKIFKIDRDDFGANMMFVIDESGSTAGHTIAIEREVVITLMEALEGTAINTCVVGFSAQSGAKVVGERVYKEFNAPLDSRKLDKINSDSAGMGFYENRDGDSFEIAAKHFATTNHKNSIMIVLSDGMPSHCSQGYNDGNKLTNKSVRELRSNGIKLHGVGIGIGDGVKYGEIYDKRDYTLLDLNDLKEKLIHMVRKIADGVEIPNM